MDAQIERIIKEMAPKLPILMEHTHELHFVDGSELIAQGHTELEDGRKVYAGLTYEQNMPVMIAMNHERRLRKAYKKHGKEGVFAYIDELNKLALNQ
jgi:hypothetical protein